MNVPVALSKMSGSTKLFVSVGVAPVSPPMSIDDYVQEFNKGVQQGGGTLDASVDRPSNSAVLIVTSRNGDVSVTKAIITRDNQRVYQVGTNIFDPNTYTARDKTEMESIINSFRFLTT